jgi:hypothetical protein
LRCRTGRSSGSTSPGLRLFERLFDEHAFLSPFGIRALSRYHAEHPFEIQIDGAMSSVDYEPAKSTTGMFGGNSNCASDLRDRFGGVERLQKDPEWSDNILFNEYFHGDNSAGLGASHQTG